MWSIPKYQILRHVYHDTCNLTETNLTLKHTHGNSLLRNNIFHFPTGFSPEAAKWLVDNRKIAGIGSDSISLEKGPSFAFPTHVIILSANIFGESISTLFQSKSNV